MDYTPGEEALLPRSLRMPQAAWDEIEARAASDKRKPLDWLRLQIYQHILRPRPVRQARRRAA